MLISNTRGVPMKALFMPEWTVDCLDVDDQTIQGPDKYVKSNKYWFFKYDTNNHFDVDIKDSRFLRDIQMEYLNFFLSQSMSSYMKNKNYDVFFSHGFKSAAVFSMLCKIFNNNKPHYIFDVGCVNGARNNSKYFVIYKKALESNCFLISHTKCQLDFYKKNLKLMNEPVFIRFGADTDFFQPKGIEKKGYILSFGNSARDNNTLLKSWAKMDTQIELHLVGGFPSDKNYPKNVKLFPRMSIIDLMTKIEESLFVIVPLPELNYSCGQMSVLQSMSMGTPVLVTKVPSTIDYIGDGNGAIFVKPYDENDMCEKIKYMLNDKNLTDLAANARSYVIDNCSEKIMAEQIFDYVLSKDS